MISCGVKCSVAKNMAGAYNIKTRKDGCFEGEKHIITRALGILAVILMPKIMMKIYRTYV